MGWDPNQGPPSGSDPYGAPSNPYGAPPPTNPNNPPAGDPSYPPPMQEYPSAQGYAPNSGYPPAPGYQPGYPAPGYPPGQGYPPNYGYANASRGQWDPTPSASPLPLGQALRELPKQYLKVLTKPGVQTFVQEQGKASWDIVWMQLLIYGVVAAILAFLARLISPIAFNNFSSTSTTLSSGTEQLITLGSSIGSIVWIPIIFFIVQGVFFLLAKAFGGEGTFLRQSYANLLINVPIGLLTSLIGLIPIVGLFGFFLGIYGLVLYIFSIMAVHRLSGGKASGVVLIPLAILLLLICGLAIAFIAIIAAIFRSVQP